jgi:hypothetical protein
LLTLASDKVTYLDDIRDIPAPERNGNQTTTDHTWRPSSLIRLAANPPEPPTIGGLLYPGERTVLSGETESMKTWLALILAKAEMDIGLPVCWADLDAMGPGAMLERLQLLGATDDQIDELFLYIQPSEMLDPTKITELADTVTATGARLFVIDAFNPILSLHGLDPNSVSDVETFWRTMADPICNAGGAPVLLDHVVKNPDNRGKYASGSERKASGAIVHLGFKLLEPLRKGGQGRTLLNVHKDRPGYLPRPTIGRLVLTSDSDTISYRIEPDKSHDETGGFRPTVLMEKISRYLVHQSEPISKNQIETAVDGKTDGKRKALEILVEEGYASRADGPNRAKLFTHIRPYIEAEDTPNNPPFSGSPQVRPEFAPDLRSSHTSGFAPTPPHGGRGRTGGATQERTSPQVRPDPYIHEYEHPPLDDSIYDHERDQQLHGNPVSTDLEW